VLGRLRPTDAASLVKFDNRVQRLWPAAPLGDGVAQRAAVAGIHSGGNTNLHGGWMEGADTLAEVAGKGLKRVVLLSDGQANEGVIDSDVIATQCAEWAARGITTSTYGLGDDFNEELMVAMARSGGGNHYYGETAEDLMEPFQQELELLGNLYLRDLRLSVSAPDGLKAEVMNQLQATSTGWRLPDLAWGAEAWAVVRVMVPAAALSPIGGLCKVLSVTVTGQTLDGQPVQLDLAGLSVPVMAPVEFAALTEDELVARRLVELAAAEALMAMRTAASAGNWTHVEQQLEEASRRFAGNEWVAAILAAMRAVAESRERERTMKELYFSSSKLRSRLSDKAEQSHYSQAAESIDVPAYLRRKPAQGKGDF
jgi:Ca-activated chloride channel family protein